MSYENILSRLRTGYFFIFVLPKFANSNAKMSYEQCLCCCKINVVILVLL
jgi:hypothetical protein